MAIYTKLDKEKVVSIISNYNLGNMNNYQGIKEGIENTNYLVETDKAPKSIEIDPDKILPDVDYSNDSWPAESFYQN